MAKRFTDTEKWKDPWFQDLPPQMKVFWFYLLDQCDMAGIWKVNLRLAEFQINTTGLESIVKEHFNGRIHVFDNGKKWFIKKFIEFQYGTLNPSVRPHQAVISTLQNHGLWEEYTKGIDTLKSTPQKRFVKPTLEEVEAYVKEKGYSINPQAFIDHYNSVGWVYGKSRHSIKDWKAAVRTWKAKDDESKAKARGQLPDRCPHCGSHDINFRMKKCDSCNRGLFDEVRPERDDKVAEKIAQSIND